jgi:hypothetical protein
MKKYVFIWQETDGFTYSHDVIIPFRCDDIEKFILESIDKVKLSRFGCEILGIYVKIEEIDNLYHSFLTLEDWFLKNEFNYEIYSKRNFKS